MAYEAEVLRRASRRLEEERSRRSAGLDRRRTVIYQKIPRLAEIDRQLRRTIAGVISAALRAGEDPAPAIGAVRAENLALQAERAGLLVRCGYPPAALDEKPACPRCGDSGWVGAEMCGCLKALCAREQIAELSKLLDLGDRKSVV